MWKYKDPQTGELKALKIDERYIQSIEERLGLKTKEQRETFRTSIRKIYGQKMSVEPGYDFMDNIDLINAHGTSTPLGDLSESIAIRRVFGDYTDKIPVHSTKSMVGHLIAAAGSVEAIASIMAIKESVIHPSINVFEQDPDINLNVAANKPLEKEVNHVISNSFGFGGQNATIIISKFLD